VNIITGKEIAKVIGQAVRTQRLTKKLTQAYVAEQLEVEPETMSRWEIGASSLSLERLVQLASVLDCEVAEFFKPLFQEQPDTQSLRIISLFRSLTTEDQLILSEFLEAAVKLLKRK
jgi:transcriptional regulator with XRE-family HTH domain